MLLTVPLVTTRTSCIALQVLWNRWCAINFHVIFSSYFLAVHSFYSAWFIATIAPEAECCRGCFVVVEMWMHIESTQRTHLKCCHHIHGKSRKKTWIENTTQDIPFTSPFGKTRKVYKPFSMYAPVSIALAIDFGIHIGESIETNFSHFRFLHVSSALNSNRRQDKADYGDPIQMFCWKYDRFSFPLLSIRLGLIGEKTNIFDLYRLILCI